MSYPHLRYHPAQTAQKWRGGRRHFVAWDSEGGEIDGAPQIQLVANSEDAYIYNPKGLSTIEIFDFLLDESNPYHSNPDVNVIYVNSYDVNMWLRDVPKTTLKRLWDNPRHSVVWRGYLITYIPRKVFRLRRYEDDKKFTLWDVSGFFQTSFINACKSWLGDDPLLPLVIEGKAKRGVDLQNESLEYVLKYTNAELELLTKLCRRLEANLVSADLQITSWQGSGAIASAMFKKYGSWRYTPNRNDSWFYNAYYGGRIETFGVGTLIQELHGYDLRSAYPWAMSTIPYLDDWHKSKNLIPWGVYEVEWKSNNKYIGPFPWRTSEGTIIYPTLGRGVYWGCEVIAAWENGHQIKILNGLVPRTVSSEPYFQWVPDIFRLRNQWKSEHNSAEKVLKLGLNSLYGKVAQTTGYNPETGNIPPYHNPILAGLITSLTRSRLLSAVKGNEDAILYFATDGILSREKLQLPIYNDLGMWEYNSAQGVMVVQPGVYGWLDEEGWYWHYRGFAPGVINTDVIRQAWSEDKGHIILSDKKFIGLGAALARTSMNDWRKFVVQDKLLQINGLTSGRRIRLHPLLNLHKQFVRTGSPIGQKVLGSFYHPKWGYNPEDDIDRESDIE